VYAYVFPLSVKKMTTAIRLLILVWQVPHYRC
jgi:hypothetical protein